MQSYIADLLHILQADETCKEKQTCKIADGLKWADENTLVRSDQVVSVVFESVYGAVLPFSSELFGLCGGGGEEAWVLQGAVVDGDTSL